MIEGSSPARIGPVRISTSVEARCARRRERALGQRAALLGRNRFLCVSTRSAGHTPKPMYLSKRSARKLRARRQHSTRIATVALHASPMVLSAPWHARSAWKSLTLLHQAEPSRSFHEDTNELCNKTDHRHPHG